MTISAVETIELKTHFDARGSLIALDRSHGLPFDAKRIFYVFDCPQTAIRGTHAVSADLVVCAIRGSLRVDLDNGDERDQQVLSQPNRALYIRRGVWVQLRDFQPDTVVLVASDESYEDVTYFDTPVAELCNPSQRGLAA